MPKYKVSERARQNRNAYVRKMRARYPKDWPQIKERIHVRSKGRCECTGECGLHQGGRCIEIHGRQGKNMAGKVQLQVAHLNSIERDCRDENLKGMCQRCHLRYDRVLHADSSRRTRNKQRGQIDALDELSFQDTLTALQLDLEGNPMRVILIPAPDPRHSNHKVRAVESRPPPWYLDIAARWGYHKRGQGRFERQKFLRAINRAREGFFTGASYMDAVLEVVRHAQRNPQEVFCR